MESNSQDNWQGFVRQLLRTEVTPNGTIVEYWSNAAGGEDVLVKVPMISSEPAVPEFK